MKYLFAIILLAGLSATPAFAQELKNPSLIINNIEIPSDEFNRIQRDSYSKTR